MAKAAIIFALGSVILVAVNCALGIACRFGWATVLSHFQVAIPTTIVALLGWMVVLFYFIGAVAWIEEEVALGAPKSLEDSARELRGVAIPWPLMAMAILSATYILGGGSHSGAVPWVVHLVLAVAALVIHLVACYRTIVFVGMMLDVQGKVPVHAS